MPKPNRARALAACALAVLPLASAPSLAAPASDATLIATIREYLHRAGAAGFSGAVAISRGEATLLSEGVGFTSCDGSTAVTPETAFYIASLSKSFTAAAVLRLEEQGRLSVSDGLARHLPGVPEDKLGITVHHLLSHSSGLGELPRSADSTAATRQEFESAALAQPLRSAPGATYRYSNLGYSLLAAIVERASGRPFAAFVREELIVPAGLTETWVVTEPSPATGAARACNGGLDQGDALLSHQRPFRWSALGAVGVVSTAPDLLRWTVALRSGALLGPAAAQRMFAPQAESYGYGWVIRTLASGRRVISHDGLLLPEGWNADLRIYPDEDLTVVVLSNAYDEDAIGWAVAGELGRLIFGGGVTMPPREAPAPVTEGEVLAGSYRLPDGSALRVVARGGRLLMEAIGQSAADLLVGIDSARSVPLRDANRRTATLLAALVARAPERAGEEVTGRPVAEWAPAALDTWSWLTERLGPATGAEVLNAVPAPFGDRSAMVYARVRFQHGNTIVRLIWDEGTFQRMSDRGAFIGATPAVAPVPGPLSLVRTGAGSYTGLRLTSGRALTVRFTVDAAGCRTMMAGGVVARREEPRCAVGATPA